MIILKREDNNKVILKITNAYIYNYNMDNLSNFFLFPDHGFKILETSKFLNPEINEGPLPSSGGAEELGRSPWPIGGPTKEMMPTRKISQIEI